MGLFSRRRSAWHLERELDSLRREISALAGAIPRKAAKSARHASHRAPDLHGLYDSLYDQAVQSLPHFGSRRRQVERIVRDHPVEVAASVGLLALGAAALLTAWCRRG